jgi:hypothetical protein
LYSSEDAYYPRSEAELFDRMQDCFLRHIGYIDALLAKLFPHDWSFMCRCFREIERCLVKGIPLPEDHLLVHASRTIQRLRQKETPTFDSIASIDRVFRRRSQLARYADFRANRTLLTLPSTLRHSDVFGMPLNFIWE